MSVMNFPFVGFAFDVESHHNFIECNMLCRKAESFAHARVHAVQFSEEKLSN